MFQYLFLFLFLLIEFQNVSADLNGPFYTEEVDPAVLETMFWKHWFEMAYGPFHYDCVRYDSDQSTPEPNYITHRDNASNLLRVFYRANIPTNDDLFTTMSQCESLPDATKHLKNTLPSYRPVTVHLREMDDQYIVILGAYAVITRKPTFLCKDKTESDKNWMIAVPTYKIDTLVGYFLLDYRNTGIDPGMWHPFSKHLKAGGTIVAFADHERKHIYHRKVVSPSASDGEKRSEFEKEKKLVHFAKKFDKKEKEREIEKRLKLKDVNQYVDYLITNYGPTGFADVDLERSDWFPQTSEDTPSGP